MELTNKIQKLIDKGVRIITPESVEIGDDVDPDRISGERSRDPCRLQDFR